MVSRLLFSLVKSVMCSTVKNYSLVNWEIRDAGPHHSRSVGVSVFIVEQFYIITIDSLHAYCPKWNSCITFHKLDKKLWRFFFIPDAHFASRHCIMNGSLQYRNNFQSLRSFSPVSHSMSSAASSPRFIHPDLPTVVYKIGGRLSTEKWSLLIFKIMLNELQDRCQWVQ